MKQYHFEQLVKGVQEMTAHMAGETVAGIRVTALDGTTQNKLHQGSDFDGFLKAEGVHANAFKRALAEKCVQEMQSSVQVTF